MWHNHQEIPIKKFIQFPAKLVCTQLNGAVDKRMMLLLGKLKSQNTKTNQKSEKIIHH
jgi:hypothetical protein